MSTNSWRTAVLLRRVGGESEAASCEAGGNGRALAVRACFGPDTPRHPGQLPWPAFSEHQPAECLSGNPSSLGVACTFDQCYFDARHRVLAKIADLTQFLPTHVTLFTDYSVHCIGLYLGVS